MERIDFIEQLGVETITESRSRRTMSLKERILNSISKEIELIKPASTKVLGVQ